MSVQENMKANQRIPEFRDWETAAKRSRERKAISSRPVRAILTGAGLITPVVNVHIVKEPGKDPYAVYAYAVGVKIPFTIYRPTSREVDSIPWWKAF